MEEVKAELESLFLDNTLTNIEVYNVHENYFEIKEGKTWIFDGGIEMYFGTKHFTLAWDYGNDSFDYSTELKAEGFLKDLEHYSVDIKAAEAMGELVGQKISKVDFVWEYYQEFDEEGELKDEKVYVPMGLDFTFSSGKILQVALVEGRIDRETLGLASAYYNLIGQLLISVDNEIKIEMQADA